MGAIVKVDKRHYRKIAQENWGLTNQQMEGMHVHHRTPRSQGGTNDPSNLYVCSPYFHAHVWHDKSEFTRSARKGGLKGGNSNSLKQQKARSLPATDRTKKAVRKTGLANRGRKLKTTHNNQAKITNSQEWECLVTGKILPPGPLSHWQIRRGIETSLRRKLNSQN